MKLLNYLNINVKIFPCNIYNFQPVNYGYDDKKVKLIHFCGIIVDHYLHKKGNSSNSIKNIIKTIKFRILYSKILKMWPKFLRIYVERFLSIKLLIKFFVLYPFSSYWLLEIIKTNYRIFFPNKSILNNLN